MTRRLKLLLGVALVLGAAAVTPVLTGAQSADVKADYDRANSLRDRVANKVYDEVQTPTWIPGTGKFWYRRTVKGGGEFVLVDPAAPSKAAAFDHAKIAASLSTASGAAYTATTLPFNTFTFADNQQAIDFTIGGGGRGGAGGRGGPAAQSGQPPPPRWHCTLTDYQCTRSTAPAAPPAGGGQGGRGGRGGGAPGAAATDQPQFRVSPDGKTEAFIENFNVFVRPVAAPGASNRPAPATPLSWDGSEGNFYTFASLRWSGDSKKLAAYRRVPGYQRMVSYVQSSPSDQLQPKSSSRYYQKPGDLVNFDQPVLFNLDTKQQFVVDRSLFPNPYSNGQIEWRKDSRTFIFDYNQRGHQVYRVIEVDAATGKARAVIEETSKTFIDYRAPNSTLSDSGRTGRWDVNDGKEIVWMSERDGWAHLYLYDGVTGQLKNQITKGNWLVRSVDSVDAAKRQIWFTASGMTPGRDPYFLNYYRINFDGTGLTTFTPGDGYHNVTWSPDKEYYVDTYSRVDMPPVTELRRASDQKVVMELEKADATDLMATGWHAPEVFVAKARDGATDIWGIIIRPTNFDPAKKYPVIENIYAGPQGSFVPKTFSTQTGMQTYADLGFIVVQIDGMGTANRSKAFHDVAWKNLGDAGFPDRILWHKAVAAKYPYYDATRVGVYGTSAGGQNAAGAVIFHPEFYKAAFASAGCHDNRMDKIWWNEQWMGWPIGPEYSASSNVDNAAKLGGALFLLVGEMDTNVDPSSTMQVVNRLILANKDFDLLVIPNADHTGGGAYGDHKRFDFFMRHLRGVEPPSWNTVGATPVGAPGVLDDEIAAWTASEDFGADFGQGSVR